VTRPVGDDDLMAWVDGRLTPERREAVNAYLAENPEQAARMAGHVAQSRALTATLAPIAEEPVPAWMRVDKLRAVHRPPPWRQALAASLLLCIGFGGGWMGAHQAMPPRAGIGALADEATDNYRVFAADRLRSAELGPEQRELLVRWSSARLGNAVTIPELDRLGLRFAGGRLIATPHGPALLLLYAGDDGGSLGLVTRRMEIDKTATMVATRRNGLGTMSWATAGMGFSLVGPNQTDLLNRAAAEVQRQVQRT
jgi:anti-sigma factor RsiW